MIKCKTCGFNNMDTAERCLKCRAKLEITEDDLRGLPTGDEPRIVQVAPVLRRGIRQVLRKLFVAPLPEDLPHRQPILAGFLGLIPGLGQLYNRRFKKAFWVVFFWIVGLALVLLTLHSPTRIQLTITSFWLSNTIIFWWLCFMLWAANDAFVDACRINGQQWRRQHSWALFFGEVFLIGLLAILSQFFGSPFLKFIYITQPGFEPTLLKGDRVMIETITFMFREPRRGEIIFYNPERFMIELPGSISSTTYSINERQSFERVIGLPGETVEMRDGRFFVDGRPLPPKFAPLGSDIPLNFKLTAEEDEYIAIFSHVPTDSLLGIREISQAPDLGTGALNGWEDTCKVNRDDIFGRVIAIYYTPPRRRWTFPPEDPLKSNRD